MVKETMLSVAVHLGTLLTYLPPAPDSCLHSFETERIQSLEPDDVHCPPKYNVCLKLVEPWGSLVAGDEGCIGPRRKLLCLCKTQKM